MTSRKKPGVAFWATVVVVVVFVAYPLSAGPVSWIARWLVDGGMISFGQAEWFLEHAYAPAQWLVMNGPAPLLKAVEWYMKLWI